MPDSTRLNSVETTRLRLRPRTLADFDANLAMDLEPEVGRYLYPFGRPSEAQLREKLKFQLGGEWPQPGGIWSVEWRQRPSFLGWCGLFPLDGDAQIIEIGYRYSASTWGQGVATEAAAAVLAIGFDEFGFDPIVAVTHPDNGASQHVLEKIGLRPKGLRRAYGLDLPFFELYAVER